MRYAIIAVVALLLVQRSTGFTSLIPRSRIVGHRYSVRFSSPQEDTDEGDDRMKNRTTFDQAGRGLMDEQDNKRMEAMGDFDANPDVREKGIPSIKSIALMCD